MHGEQWISSARSAQRHQFDRKHVEPEIQVLAEAATPYLRLQIAVVAAMTRTSTLRVRASPTRSN